MADATASHTCPHCGAVYVVKPGKQNRAHAYHTATCSHCGDVMAQWDGGARRYRRIKRPRGLEHARKLVNEIAAARPLRRRALRSRPHQ
jgi:ribosomal protein S27E